MSNLKTADIECDHSSRPPSEAKARAQKRELAKPQISVRPGAASRGTATTIGVAVHSTRPAVSVIRTVAVSVSSPCVVVLTAARVMSLRLPGVAVAIGLIAICLATAVGLR